MRATVIFNSGDDFPTTKRAPERVSRKANVVKMIPKPPTKLKSCPKRDGLVKQRENKSKTTKRPGAAVKLLAVSLLLIERLCKKGTVE